MSLKTFHKIGKLNLLMAYMQLLSILSHEEDDLSLLNR